MPEQVSDKPWSNFKASDYTDEQWLRACLIDRGASFGSAKMRGSLPVREPDGTLNRNACAAASAVLSLAGGTGSARGNKLLGVKPAQIASARSKLVSLYKTALQQDPPAGLTGVVKHDGDLISKVLSHIDANAESSDGDSPGNTGACLVALPTATDQIRLVGDEDKHASLLFLGETSSLAANAKTVLSNTLAQVANIFDGFSESILDIQRLGSNVPPALVTILTDRYLSKIRESLLLNPEIQGYLSNTPQHPAFTPHVTLGYPDYAGEPQLRTLASTIYRVRFDRLALWWGDEHIEFNLLTDDNSYDEDSAEVGMSDIASNFLAHHGVKGMRWGVRKNAVAITNVLPGSTIKSTKTSTSIGMRTDGSSKPVAPSKQERKGANAAGNTIAKGLIRDIHTEKAFEELNRINSKHSGVVNNPTKKGIAAYDRDMSNFLTGYAKKHVAEGQDVHAIANYANRSVFLIHGTPEAVQTFKNDANIRHSDNVERVTLRMILGDDGLFSGVSEPIDISHADIVSDFLQSDNVDSKSLKHDDLLENFLVHHGVKGMRWGVRRSSDQLSKTHGGKLVSAKDRLKALVFRKKSSEVPNAKVEPKKVEEQSSDTKLSEDAEKALKASLKSPSEMSTREMQELVNRANVAKQYNDLFNKSQKSDMQKQVEQLQLQKQLRDLQNDLNPKKTSRFGIIKTSQETADFLETAARGYTAYARLNAATGGALARQLSVPVIDPDKISSLGGGGGKKKK